MRSVLHSFANLLAAALLAVGAAKLVETVLQKPAAMLPQPHDSPLDISRPPRNIPHWSVFAAFAVAITLAAAASWMYDRIRIEREANAATGGVGSRAVAVMINNGCAGCHTIPGVPGASGTVGPKLDGTLSVRSYIAGTVPNSPRNMVRWLQAARDINEKTVMPSTGITDQEARDVAAYLYALR